MVANSVSKVNVNEVTFANNIYEFSRFYDKHFSLCKELAGIKEVIFKDRNDNSKEVREIKKRLVGEFFRYAIDQVGSFIIDNLHYLDNVEIQDLLINKIDKLEKDFINDYVFINLSKDSKRNINEETVYQQKYFSYLLRCFEITSEAIRYLQTSLMISPKSILKIFVFHDDTKFFINLGTYRDEISRSIGQYRFSYTLDHIKEVLGYYYSYNVFMDYEYREEMEIKIRKLINLTINGEIIYLIENYSQDSDFRRNEVLELSYKIKRLLRYVYVKTNESMQKQKVLPKKVIREYIDKTTI